MCSVESGMTKEQSQGRCCLWGHPLLSSWDILMYGLTPPLPRSTHSSSLAGLPQSSLGTSACSDGALMWNCCS